MRQGGKFQERLQRFMYGRYGVDSSGRAVLGLGFVLMLLSLLLGKRIPTQIPMAIALLCIIYCYFRMFSRNIQKRTKENYAYQRFISPIRGFFAKRIMHMKQRKTHHIFKCPNCKQKIRIPKGKGRIAIRCPKCQTEFIKVSR